jgi:hypothetical protein
MGSNARAITFPFHTASTAIGDGEELNVGGGMVVGNIAVTGNAAGFTLVVEAKDNDTDDYTSIAVANLETLAVSPNITANGKYQVGLEAHIKLRTRLSVIGGGSCTSKITVVN